MRFVDSPQIELADGRLQAAFRAPIEPARPDPKADRITASQVLKQQTWTPAQLDRAIGAYNFPRPLGRVVPRVSGGVSEPFYSRAQIAAWAKELRTFASTIRF